MGWFFKRRDKGKYKNTTNKFGTNYRKEFHKYNRPIFGGYRCAYCGKKLTLKTNTLTVDHVIPKTRLGANKLWDANKGWNQIAACGSCNSSKSNKLKDIRVLKGFIILRIGGIFRIIENIVYKNSNKDIPRTMSSFVIYITSVMVNIFKIPRRTVNKYPILFITISILAISICIFGTEKTVDIIKAIYELARVGVKGIFDLF